MGRNDDYGEAIIGQRFDDLVNFRNRADIDAPRRLVKDHKLWALPQNCRDHHLLLISARSSITRASELIVRMFSFSRPPAQADHLRSADDRRPHGGELSGINVLCNRHAFREESLDLAILGDIDDAIEHRFARNEIGHRPIFQEHLTPMKKIPLQDACDDFGGSPVRPDPIRPNTPVICPL